ncbi:thiamine phosphate synthase [uncultured Megasphaera sp.]|uniref:thiamine phosphate synthase n=1 Tax=uncultured Megasphaera sp. TaxID=165188 RepID=UPI0026589717|nr:thiamine phosphate synthase [uncultured Megasphaera sp.]
MLKIAAVTNHELAKTNYWDQLEQITASDVDYVILREKTLSEEEYTDYAKKALRLCNMHGKTCVLHHFGKVAVRLRVPRFQCSLEYLETHSSLLYYMTTLGVSVHTPEEAKRAEELGATYIMASHVFPTDCKKTLPPIGPEMVNAICQAVSIPVYALGGITPQTVQKLHDTPITGVALMSGLMTCPDVPEYIRELRQ